MLFTGKAPCATCPFLRKGGIALHPGRAESIASVMLESQGATFQCHKTTGKRGKKGAEGLYCVGAMLFALKNETMPQLMRINHRLRQFDPDALLASPAAALVFDTRDEMVQEHAASCGQTGRR